MTKKKEVKKDDDAEKKAEKPEELDRFEPEAPYDDGGDAEARMKTMEP